MFRIVNYNRPVPNKPKTKNYVSISEWRQKPQEAYQIIHSQEWRK